MFRDVFNYIKFRKECQLCKRAYNFKKVPLGTFNESADEIDCFKRWHMDFLSMSHKTKESFNCVLVMVDNYSGWPECIDLNSQEAQEVAKALFAQVISRF